MNGKSLRLQVQVHLSLPQNTWQGKNNQWGTRQVGGGAAGNTETPSLPDALWLKPAGHLLLGPQVIPHHSWDQSEYMFQAWDKDILLPTEPLGTCWTHEVGWRSLSCMSTLHA